MDFQDRVEAGERLAREIEKAILSAPIVLGIPRGGVAVAAPIARALGADLGVLVARKIGAPGRSELGIGATTAGGVTVIDERLARAVGADEDYLRAEIAREIEEARRRERAFDGRHRTPLTGHDVILVDDGIATGVTIVAAARAARAAGARRVLVAVPVASPRALDRLSREVDGIACLVRDDTFEAVGAYYEDFHQVEDDEVRAILDSFTART
jgi:predicted phosphoribosyltransferase